MSATTSWIRRTSIPTDHRPRASSLTVHSKDTQLSSFPGRRKTETDTTGILSTQWAQISASNAQDPLGSASSSSLAAPAPTLVSQIHNSTQPCPRSVLARPSTHKKKRPSSYHSYFNSHIWVSSASTSSSGVTRTRSLPPSSSASGQHKSLDGTATNPAPGVPGSFNRPNPPIFRRIRYGRRVRVDEQPTPSPVTQTPSSSIPCLTLDVSTFDTPLTFTAPPDSRAPLSFVVDRDLANDLLASWSKGETWDVWPTNSSSTASRGNQGTLRSLVPGSTESSSSFGANAVNYHYHKRSSLSTSLHSGSSALPPMTGAGPSTGSRRMSTGAQEREEIEDRNAHADRKQGKSVADDTTATSHARIEEETGELAERCLSSAFLADIVSLNGDDDDDDVYIELGGETAATDTSGPFSPSSSHFCSTQSSRSSVASSTPPMSPVDPVQTHVRTYVGDYMPMFRALDSLPNLHSEGDKTTIITPFVSSTAFINPRPAPKPPVVIHPSPEVAALRAMLVYGPHSPTGGVGQTSGLPATFRSRSNSTISTLKTFNSLRSHLRVTSGLADGSRGASEGRFGSGDMSLNADDGQRVVVGSDYESKRPSFLSRLKVSLGRKSHSKGNAKVRQRL